MGVELRPAVFEDAYQIYEWQIQPETRRFFRNPNPPTWDEHLNWIKKKLGVEGIKLLMICLDKKKCGFLHLTRIKLAEYEISILIGADFKGQGIAKTALQQLRKRFPFLVLYAEVNAKNLASRKLFASAGFVQIGAEAFESRPRCPGKCCVIRANSGDKVGLGHFRRCFELAIALADKKLSVFFIEPKKDFAELFLSDAGFQVIRAADTEEDICQAVEGADLLLIDHYSLDLKSIAYYSNRSWKLVVFEDNGKRALPVDVAINGSPSADTMNFSSLGAKQALAGTKYQVIRSDLRELKQRQGKYVNSQPHKLLVTIGASDEYGILDRFIKILDRHICQKWPSLQIDIIAGPQVKKTPLSPNISIRVHHSPENMAELIVSADVAISAAGQTLMELLFCAVPSVVFCLADNQLENLNALDKENCIISTGNFNYDGWQDKFITALQRLLTNNAIRNELAANATSLVDGQGSERIATRLTELL